jgi:hypothetical protein
MQRYGHKLTITTIGTHLVATCECGKWRRGLPLSDDKPLSTLVGALTGKHNRHLERLGRPSAMDSASHDALPVLPDNDAQPGEAPKR